MTWYQADFEIDPRLWRRWTIRPSSREFQRRHLFDHNDGRVLRTGYLLGRAPNPEAYSLGERISVDNDYVVVSIDDFVRFGAVAYLCSLGQVVSGRQRGDSSLAPARYLCTKLAGRWRPRRSSPTPSGSGVPTKVTNSRVSAIACLHESGLKASTRYGPRLQRGMSAPKMPSTGSLSAPCWMTRWGLRLISLAQVSNRDLVEWPVLQELRDARVSLIAAVEKRMRGSGPISQAQR